MKNISKPIVFFGTEDFSLTALLGLLEGGYTIAAVITKPDSKKGRGQRITAPRVKELATRYNIPVWQPQKLSEIAGDIQKLKDPVGVLVSYGKIIPSRILDLFPLGIINLHPSLLPLYRGPSPIESAILNGDKKTGVSIMRLISEMDAGPVYTAKEYILTGNETRPELYQALATLGTDLLLEALPDIINETLKPIAQDETHATYCQLLSKTESTLEPAMHTAEQAERRVRAFLGFPKTKLLLKDRVFVITKAHVSDRQKTPLDVMCRDGAYLSVDELVAPSGRRIKADDFLRGYSI